MYGNEKQNEPECSKSRTDLIIMFADFPVLCISRLQTETALSTMEAEIIALAHFCREMFPMIDIPQSLGKEVGLTVGG